MPISVSITLQFLQQEKTHCAKEIFHNEVVIVGGIGEIECRMELIRETERNKVKIICPDMGQLNNSLPQLIASC